MLYFLGVEKLARLSFAAGQSLQYYCNTLAFTRDVAVGHASGRIDEHRDEQCAIIIKR